MNFSAMPDDAEDRTGRHKNWKLAKAEQSTSKGSSTSVELTTRKSQNSDRRAESSDQGPTATTRLDHGHAKSDGIVNPVQIQRRASIVSVASGSSASTRVSSTQRKRLPKAVQVLIEYFKFVGPGFMIAVAYIDPGNYATDINAGASTQYKLLFMVLMSNLIAIIIQSLSILLGSVTGLDLAQNCRKHLPPWLNWILYLLAEAAIIATDIAEVIGTAIALNLLLRCPLIAGCIISLVDVLLCLFFYNPEGSMARLRWFECFVAGLVIGVMICFCIQLSYIHNTSAAEVMRGYLPSAAIIEGNGIYLSCGILGATVMPHSIFLGSGLIQPRLRKYDVQNGHHVELDPADENSSNLDDKYRPSIHAIRSCLKYSIVELAISLFSFALFINSAILIVAGSALYPGTEATDADLFGIHDLLSHTISKPAGSLFAVALLLSGTSAGIVCTMAGQMVSEGMINWKIKAWKRRLITRSIAIVPSIIIAAAVGKEGLNAALTASQVTLSVILPFVTAPLIWFTCRSTIMTVKTDVRGPGPGIQDVNMRNGWILTILAVLIWLVLVVMNVALIVLVALGKA